MCYRGAPRLCVRSVSFTTVGNDYVLELNFNNDLPNGIYSYEFNIILSSARAFGVYMYGDCGGSGYDDNTLYRFWSWAKTMLILRPGASVLKMGG